MQNIEDIAMNNYKDNMEYFEKNHKQVHRKMLALETVLNDGSIEQKYDLEYKDNYFDVIELKSGHFLYSQNSDEYGTKLCNDISMKKNEQVCETFYEVKYAEDALEHINKSSPIERHVNLAPVTSYYNNNTSSDMQFKKIEKFMFLGLGLSTHVQKIIDKVKPTVSFLVEDDVELFRLSLFTCNYKNALSNTFTVFSIGENMQELNLSIAKFYDREILFNQYIKFSLFSDSYQSKIKSIQEYVITRPERLYSHNRLLDKNKKVLERIYDKYKFLVLSKKENETLFKDKPVIVIGAGPSLQKNIEWLLQNKDNFIIIAVFAALKTLQKYNISPDIVVQMDENVSIWNKILKTFDDFEFSNNTMFLFAASVPKIFLETFNSKNIFLYEDRTYYKQNKVHVVASSVGELTYSTSLIFNAKDTYLLGLDLALTDSGLTHTQDHYKASTMDVSNTDTVVTNTHLDNSVFKIKGNFRETVLSNPTLAMSIPLVDNYTKKLKSSNQNVYNLCDGAYFTNTIPMRTKDIKKLVPINKKEISSEINKMLNSYSSSSLSQEDIESMQFRKKQLSIIRAHIESFEHAPTSNAASFTRLYKIMVNNFIQLDDTSLKELLLVYMLNTGAYIIDFFNTQELDNPKKHTKKMKKIIVTEYYKIIDYYEDIINNKTVS